LVLKSPSIPCKPLGPWALSVIRVVVGTCSPTISGAILLATPRIYASGVKLLHLHHKWMTDRRIGVEIRRRGKAAAQFTLAKSAPKTIAAQTDQDDPCC